MFDIWRKIEEKGAVAVPVKPSALSALGWVEVGEKYPVLMPEEFRDYDVYSDPQLIRESPFVNRKGTGYLFVTTDPITGNTLDAGIWENELINVFAAEDYQTDDEVSTLMGVLTCSACGVPGCAGLWSQSFHVSSKMVHWSVKKYKDEFDLFFEREVYEAGAIRMLRDMVEHPGVYNTPECSRYHENHEAFVEQVIDMLDRRAYFKDMWDEVGAEATAQRKD